MLTDLLRIIARGELRSQIDIARSLGIPAGMVSMMAKQLARQGYLEEINPGCSCNDESALPKEGACSDCPANSSCGFEAKQLWSLTEKGWRAAAS